MGTGEENTNVKPCKSASSNQEVPNTPSYPDWSNSMQAYYGTGGTAPPFFASTVAPPTPHPYMWGGQHLIPPYGTPVPYPAIYPPQGVYAAYTNTASSSAQTTKELDAKGCDGKYQASAKKSKRSSVSAGGRNGESGKAASGSGNDGPSQSAESSSEGSSEASEDDENRQESSASKKESFEKMLGEEASAQNKSTGTNNKAAGSGKSVISVPATHLNTGMALWNTSLAAGGPTKMRQGLAGASLANIPAAATPEQWTREERELKRQKRKQSNRESARRSRLRKQAQCEEVQKRVENLTNEICSLRDELQRITEECNKLATENNSIEEELTQLYGSDAVSKPEESPARVLQSQSGEYNSYHTDRAKTQE